jgi:hypothetical protein
MSRSHNRHDDDTTYDDIDDSFKSYGMAEDISKSFNEDESEHNSHNDSSTNVDDSYNTETEVETEIEDSYNSDSSTTDTEIDVEIEESFNHVQNAHNDSSVDTDTDIDIDVDIEDSFNTTDDEFADVDIGGGTTLDNLFINSGTLDFNPGDDVNFENVFNGAFSGGGSDSGFAINQVADILDGDTLHNVQQNNGGADFKAFSIGGDDLELEDSHMSSRGGDDASTSATVDGSAYVNANAFNMEVVLGANLQQNAVDITVVGGNNSMGNDSGDDDA